MALTSHVARVPVAPTGNAATVNVVLKVNLAQVVDAVMQNAAAVFVLTASAAAMYVVMMIHSVARMDPELTSVGISLVTALMFSPESSEAVK